MSTSWSTPQGVETNFGRDARDSKQPRRPRSANRKRPQNFFFFDSSSFFSPTFLNFFGDVVHRLIFFWISGSRSPCVAVCIQANVVFACWRPQEQSAGAQGSAPGGGRRSECFGSTTKYNDGDTIINHIEPICSH
jgi:hypothetical protein